MLLDKKFWAGRYATQTTGWDIGSVSPQLVLFFKSLKDKGLRILIPGCGNGHEAIWLANHGFTQVTVVDLAQAPLDHLESKVPNQVNCIRGNFFELEGQFDLIIEQTFFCALDPNLREDYVQKMVHLLAPNGKITGLLFNKDFEKGGPPFGGSRSEYIRLFEPKFHMKVLDKAGHSIPSRLGNELFFEFLVK